MTVFTVTQGVLAKSDVLNLDEGTTTPFLALIVCMLLPTLPEESRFTAVESTARTKRLQDAEAAARPTARPRAKKTRGVKGVLSNFLHKRGSDDRGDGSGGSGTQFGAKGGRGRDESGTTGGRNVDGASGSGPGIGGGAPMGYSASDANAWNEGCVVGSQAEYAPSIECTKPRILTREATRVFQARFTYTMVSANAPHRQDHLTTDQHRS